MRESKLRGVDLNLLAVLRVLLETRNATLAAQRLNMSQPAVSRALAKLRTQFGDKLLVKGAGGMIPTLRAEALAEPLSLLLHQVDDFLAPNAFDPSTTQRLFRIAATDYGAIAVLPKLMPAFTREAPLAGIEVLPFSNEVFRQCGTGQVDIVLYSDDPVPAAMKTRLLFNETYSCLLRAGHPLLANEQGGQRRRLSVDEFIAYPHAMVRVIGGRTGLVDESLAVLERKWHVAIKLPYFAAAGLICRDSDLIVVLPTQVAHTLAASGDLTLIDAPVSVTGFGYRMLWHEHSHDDAGSIWLRSLIARVTKI